MSGFPHGRNICRCNRTLIHIGANDDGHGEPTLGLLNDIDQNIFANLQQEWDSAPAIDEVHPIAHDTRWRSFRHLINTPWFRRGWVVQEAAHAQVGVVFWGDHEFSWMTIMKSYTWGLFRADHILTRFDVFMPTLHRRCFSVLSKDAVRPVMSEESWNKKDRILHAE